MTKETECFPKKTVETLDHYFKKEDARRGDALVVLAQAYIEGREEMRTMILNLINQMKENNK